MGWHNILKCIGKAINGEVEGNRQMGKNRPVKLRKDDINS